MLSILSKLSCGDKVQQFLPFVIYFVAGHSQRYEIVNGIEDVEGVIDEVATNQEGDKATEGILF